MHMKVGVRGAAGITAALVFLGANVEWNPVKAVPASTPDTVAQMCAKIDAQSYGYCCKLRLEPTCPAAGSISAKQSVPLKLNPHMDARSKVILQKVAIGRSSEDTTGDNGVNSVFVNGNTDEPGRGLGANNGGDNGNNGNAGAGPGPGPNGGSGPGTDAQ
ncbi:MAG: hypothetical protein GY948_01330 [Alphaproteobacteria bacterium]|nr:hypothetical protein [Alphaproteobacteria bacterium]